MSKVIEIVNDQVGTKPFEVPMFAHRPHRPEILVFLCGDCNLRCKFCQDQGRYNDVMTIGGIEHRFELFKQVIKQIPEDDIDVVVFGGEVFQDKYSDELVGKVGWFYQQVHELLTSLGKKHQFYTTTNLAYRKLDRVIDICKQNNVFVRASYDLWGRYRSQKIQDLFLKNIEIVDKAGLPTLINFVAYKPNVERIYNKGENFETWEYLYNNYNMCFGEYTDYVKDVNFQVSEDELGDFCIFLYENYPRITNVQNMLHPLYKPRDYIYCAYNVVIDNTVSWQCCDRNKTISKFLSNHGCLQCKYYDGCYGTCPRIFADSNVCHIRKLLDYAIKHPHNIIKD